jgi:exodeoxyribonuclease VII large subunit
MIVGRGGGSLEDLWPFNEEAVVRAVYEAQTPVISAVGHEIDFTLTDFAADYRAPTPSAAAEIVVKEQQALVEQVRALRERMQKLLTLRLDRLKGRVAMAASCHVLKRPDELVRQRRQRIDELQMRLQSAIAAGLNARKTRLDRTSRSLLLLSPSVQLHRTRERFARLHQRMLHAALESVRRTRTRLGPALARLDTLSPLAILSRGYSLTWRLPERTLVRDAQELAPGDKIYLRFGTGGATAAVEGVEENAGGPLEPGPDAVEGDAHG